MKLVVLQMEICQDCPNMETANPWSSDGWDLMVDWVCKKANRTIQKSVEWHEVKKIEIPDWCPMSLENFDSTKVE
jgi:hypothetical protein